jgi:hypothetical protein
MMTFRQNDEQHDIWGDEADEHIFVILTKYVFQCVSLLYITCTEGRKDVEL